MPALALAPRATVAAVSAAASSSRAALSCQAKKLRTRSSLSLPPTSLALPSSLLPSLPPRRKGSRQQQRRPVLSVRATGEGGDDAGPSNDDSSEGGETADETSSAFQRELARRASGGRGPAERASSAPGSRPRWAPDAVRGAPQPPPSMNRGGPVPEQLQASRDLVNEGLSGLVPRAKVLLTVGAAVPTAFVGLISVAVCVFAVLALGLEGKFIHGGKPVSAPPEVIDPYSLLDPYPREGPYLGFRE